MRNSNLFSLVLAASLLVPAFASCAAVAVGATGVIVGQSVLSDNSYVIQLTTDANRTWAQTKTSLSHLSTKPIDANNELRRAIADVDGATVTVLVETYDLDRSQIRVAATQYGFASTETARYVSERITNDLERFQSQKSE